MPYGKDVYDLKNSKKKFMQILATTRFLVIKYALIALKQ